MNSFSMDLSASLCRTEGGRKVSVQRVPELSSCSLKEVLHPNLSIIVHKVGFSVPLNPFCAANEATGPLGETFAR